MSMFISQKLKDAVREFGMNKLASEVEAQRTGRYEDLSTMEGCMRSLVMKVAMNRVQEEIVLDGVAAYNRLMERK